MGEQTEGRAEVLASANLGLRAAIVAARAGGAVAEWVRARDPDALARHDAAPADGWFSLADHVLLMDALAAVLGLDQMRAFARRRMRDREAGTPSPAVIESWTRSFAGDPTATLRVGLHLWRNLFRHAGEIEESRATASEYGVRFTHCPYLAGSAAWREMMVGTALGIADLAGIDMHADVVVVDGETVEGVMRWSAVEDDPVDSLRP